MKRYLGLFGLLVALISTSGCRFYGYPGGVAQTLMQIEAASEQAAQDLEQALAEIETLRRMARQEEALAPYVAQYETILKAHQRAVLEFEHWKEEVVNHPDDYRRANRTLGAITARHEALLQQYTEVAWAVARRVNPALQVQAPVSVGPRFFFHVLPPQYIRLVNEQAISPLQVVRYLAAQLG